ncbi:unnamed protein product [Rotaria sordida]|uniref:Eukaryotic translation initiation factor 3 subunit C N-terminal domain-containing protein n=1 Tax=Rotaria sordida TaxID=392033 RepID=A0A819F0H2_9BILA|nr:unnamed protein product [Rotaria sordida]
MSAIELINIDSNIPAYNEWNDNSDLFYEIINTDSTENMDDVEEEMSIKEIPPKLPEALDMLRRLHLFASIEQPELHVLINGNSSSSEENSDDEPQIKIQTTKSFVKSYIINNDDDDDTENVKRIVRSEKDKRYEEIEENIKKIKQVIRIRDIKQVYECFENLIKVYDKARRVIEKEQIIPRFYIKIIVQLEDFVNECWNNKDWCNKFNKTNSNNLKILRQKLRQYIQIESFQNEKNSYREVNDDVVEINETSSSDDFSSENNDDSIDNELPLNQSYINFFLQNTTITKRREKECKSIRQSDEKKFKEITSKEDILKFDNDKEILKKLNEIVSTRGKHSTNYHDQFEYLNNLRQYVKKQNLCVEIDIKILLIDITISFDYHQKENRYSKFETWTR